MLCRRGGAPGGRSGNVKLWGDPGLHNKSLGYGASEACASGPACEEEQLITSPTFHTSFTTCFNVTVFHTVVLRISLLGTVKHNK